MRGERILRDEIQCGEDELGVLLMSGRHGAVWHGSRLSTQRALAGAVQHRLQPAGGASSLVAVMQWKLANPARGVVESDALDFRPVMADTAHWWAPLSVHFTDWLPRPGATSLAFNDFLLDEATVQPDPSPLILAC